MIRLLEIDDFKCDHPKDTKWGFTRSIRICWQCRNFVQIDIVDLDDQRDEEKKSRVLK